MRRVGPWLAGAGLWAALACGGEASPDTAPDTPDTPEAAGADAVPGAAVPDSLVVLAVRDSVSPARLPPDWYDLLHPRYSDRMAFPDPSEFPLAREFMETVMRREATRTGDPRSGLDWLLRWDGTVATYYRDVRGGILPFLRGEVILLVIPASRAGDLLAGGDALPVPMQSGGLPRITFPGSGGGEDPTGNREAEVPTDWLTTWRAEVRGRNPGR